MIKYSIIIPHFNRPILVQKTIESFFDLKDKEIIIIDDLSNEENLKILKKYISTIDKKHNVKLIENKEKFYLGQIRNIGINLAKGYWIFFIDDDDWATKEFIDFLNNKKLNNKIDVYRFNYQLLNNENKVVWKVRNILIKSKMYSVQASSYLIKTSYLKEKQLFFPKEQLPYEDLQFNMNLYNTNPKTKQIHIYSINYFLSENSILRSKVDKNKIISRIDSILKEDSYNKKTYCLRLLVDFRKKFKKMNLEKDYKELVKRLDLKFIDFLRLNWFNFFLAIPTIYIFFKFKNEKN